MKEEIELGIRVIEKMMADIDQKQIDALNLQKWSRVAELESYNDGLLQALLVIKNILDKGDNND